jgi:RNA polymerase sigma-70 factor (ECF subfamily)
MTSEQRDSERRARFDALYEANYHLILGYALRRARESDALDVVAETFLVAWRRLGQMPDGDEARLWLYGTARRVLANHERTARRRARLHGRLADEASTTPIVTPDHRHGAVAAAFERLSRDDRELLGLVAWEGLDAVGIAHVVGCSRNAARIRLHRARKRFAAALDEEGPLVKRLPSPGHVSLTPLGTEDTP